MITQFEFRSPVPGPTVMFFWGIHGDEVCGPNALFEIIAAFSAGTYRLKRWTAKFVPVCNPKAYSLRTRFVEKNLNRVFRVHSVPVAYEEFLANELCAALGGVDFLLDIHSVSSGDIPFVFQDFSDQQTREFVSCLPVRHVVTWWPELYGDTEDSDMVRYARSIGAVGAVIECGQHGTVESDETAKQAIRCVLAQLSMIDFPLRRETCEYVRVVGIQRKTAPWSFVRPWKHLDRVSAGDPVAVFENGDTVRAEDDCFVLLPNALAPIGTEWFYISKPDPTCFTSYP